MLNWNDISTWVVLAIYDEPDNLEVLAETLEYRGASVKTACDGIKALEVLQDFNPNIILMDLSMPRMDGWKTRIQIRLDAKYQEVAIIALSAHAMQGDIERALKAGFDGYITKPIHILSLEEDIRTTVFENAKLNKEQAESA